MAFFNKVGETISSKSKDLAKKAKDMAEISGLNGQISSQEEIIDRAFMEIGKIYYEAHKEAPEPGYTEQCITIASALEKCEQLKNDIQIIRGTRICESCGTEIGSDSAFCPGCGTKIAVDTASQVIDSEPPAMLQQVITCSSCGLEVTSGSAFCAGCGTKIS